MQKMKLLEVHLSFFKVSTYTIFKKPMSSFFFIIKSSTFFMAYFKLDFLHNVLISVVS